MADGTRVAHGRMCHKGYQIDYMDAWRGERLVRLAYVVNMEDRHEAHLLRIVVRLVETHHTSGKAHAYNEMTRAFDSNAEEIWRKLGEDGNAVHCLIADLHCQLPTAEWYAAGAPLDAGLVDALEQILAGDDG